MLEYWYQEEMFFVMITLNINVVELVNKVIAWISTLGVGD